MESMNDTDLAIRSILAHLCQVYLENPNLPTLAKIEVLVDVLLGVGFTWEYLTETFELPMIAA